MTHLGSVLETFGNMLALWTNLTKYYEKPMFFHKKIKKDIDLGLLPLNYKSCITPNDYSGCLEESTLHHSSTSAQMSS